MTYGHFGRLSDLHETLNFTNSIVMMKINTIYDVGTMVRNAQHFGAKGVILFPDPHYNYQTGNVPSHLSKNDRFANVQGSYF